MKIFALIFVLLQVADHCSANCLAPWQDVGGQCMACNNELSLPPADYVTAQAACESKGGDLTTIINAMQHSDAMGCGGNPWIGYLGGPNPHFQDGARFPPGTLPGVTKDAPGSHNCYFSADANNWDVDPDCDLVKTFVCSKPYMTCPNLEDVGFASIDYVNPNVAPNLPPPGYQCVATTATYSCNTGFGISGGNNPRTCQADKMWSGSRPMCVHVGVCPALAKPGYAGIMYSTTLHANGMYIYGTAAAQMCDEHYEKESGTTIRVCMPGGMWSGTPIWCEKEKNELAIGLGVGLGLLLLIVIIICCIVCCCYRRPAMVPAHRPYPRPHPHHRPYPKRYY